MKVIMGIIFPQNHCYLEYKSSLKVDYNECVGGGNLASTVPLSTLLCCLRAISSELIICIGFYLLGLHGLFPRICFITVSLASGISFLQSSVLETKQAFYAMEFERREGGFLVFKKKKKLFSVGT